MPAAYGYIGVNEPGSTTAFPPTEQYADMTPDMGHHFKDNPGFIYEPIGPADVIQYDCMTPDQAQVCAL